MSSGIAIAAQAGSSPMSKIIREMLSDSSSDEDDNPIAGPHAYARSNAAVDRCCQAFNDAFEAAQEDRASSYDCRAAAKHAFCRALPALDSETNIRDFVACVTHALADEIFLQETAARLLYAAQVANSVLKASKPSRAPGRPPASPEEKAASPVNQSLTTPSTE